MPAKGYQLLREAESDKEESFHKVHGGSHVLDRFLTQTLIIVLAISIIINGLWVYHYLYRRPVDICTSDYGTLPFFYGTNHARLDTL